MVGSSLPVLLGPLCSCSGKAESEYFQGGKETVCFLVTTVFQAVTTVFVCVVFRKMWLLLWELKELFSPR